MQKATRIFKKHYNLAADIGLNDISKRPLSKVKDCLTSIR